jgi:hypothetical protein
MRTQEDSASDSASLRLGGVGDPGPREAEDDPACHTVTDHLVRQDLQLFRETDATRNKYEVSILVGALSRAVAALEIGRADLAKQEMLALLRLALAANGMARE